MILILREVVQDFLVLLTWWYFFLKNVKSCGWWSWSHSGGKPRKPGKIFQVIPRTDTKHIWTVSADNTWDSWLALRVFYHSRSQQTPGFLSSSDIISGNFPIFQLGQLSIPPILAENHLIRKVTSKKVIDIQEFCWRHVIFFSEPRIHLPHPSYRIQSSSSSSSSSTHLPFNIHPLFSTKKHQLIRLFIKNAKRFFDTLRIVGA